MTYNNLTTEELLNEAERTRNDDELVAELVKRLQLARRSMDAVAGVVEAFEIAEAS